MSTLPHPSALAAPGGLLRVALAADAAVTGLNGAAYLLAAPLLDDVLGLDAGVLRGAGAFLLVFAAAVALVARRPRPATGAVLAVVVANVAWALDSLLAAGLGWGDPTTAGTVWIVLQGLVVGGFAALQAVGLRRAPGR